MDISPPHRYSHGSRENHAITPDMDNLGPNSPGGGISGIALGIANTHSRESGIEASQGANDGYTGPAERDFNTTGSDTPYIPSTGYTNADSFHPEHAHASNMARGGALASPALQTPSQSSGHLSDPTHSTYQYPAPYAGLTDGPYQRHSTAYSNGDISNINPDDIADDGEEDFAPPRTRGASAAAGATGGATADGRKKMGWIVGLVLGFVILGAIVGGAVGGTIGNRHSEKKSTAAGADTATGDTTTNGDLDKDSSEIQALMGNPNLHKVFPGMDYTPWGVQYPDCLKWPPSQNNVTRDMAVLSQLTNTVRLYGTDCNQTEMVLHAIDRLELTDIKLWLGVWIDSNTTTTERQINHLYTLLNDTKHTPIYKGVIVGNEALYRAGNSKQSAETTLISYIREVTTEVKNRNLDLLIATSDLGDNWNAQLVEEVDVVMSNVHPFFAGVNVDAAVGWTWDFWQTHDVSLTKGTNKKQIISEVGWPSGGGKDCGGSSVCDDDTPGSVASIENMNTFMSDWICPALENGTDYFWFEAFDEPWKIQFNTPGKEWEDKWGLMDSGRNLKKGLTIPDCGGKTAS
ncbi:Glucan endo-1,3-beta-glucosidase btgC [Penicillium digitatum Pd1]|uniref:glucan endo-1,3-beta-D-glucosidase n=1 Tax=Penicillium digitatum (strain Pd1 / CECT 20795) TaxID=1170230 RepID=K9FWR8_PEND1|nr:Glucan endo-1,3-beta-glucosidase btgC [Penicillium digitatum Pd1]EKV12967.1 Glucan endo-1,3-beta-glucosidase btgC [Penicillium digitatum Pd1]